MKAGACRAAPFTTANSLHDRKRPTRQQGLHDSKALPARSKACPPRRTFIFFWSSFHRLRTALGLISRAAAFFLREELPGLEGLPVLAECGDPAPQLPLSINSCDCLTPGAHGSLARMRVLAYMDLDRREPLNPKP